MTILRVHENKEIKGGSEVYIRDVSEQLQNRGIENILLFIEKFQSQYKIYLNRELNCVIRHNELETTLSRLLKDNKIDLVHIHGISDRAIVGYFIARYKVVRTMHEPRIVCPGYSKFWVKDGKPCTLKYGLHCFYHAYSQQCFRSRKPQNVLEAYQNTEYEVKEASKKYAAILTMSEYIRDEAIKAGIAADKVICNPHFTKFSLPYFPFQGKEKRFLFVGRLIKHKGILELLNAMLPVLKNNTAIFLDIIGDGPMYDYVTGFVNDHQLKQQVIIEKWKSSEDISSLMKNAYCVLFPSIYPEAFGLVGIEAAMHSKPVIAFNTGGVATWLKNDFNGFLLNDISAEALRKGIEEIINNPGLHQRMSKNAWDFASSYFSPERHVNMLIDIYNKCIAY